MLHNLEELQQALYKLAFEEAQLTANADAPHILSYQEKFESLLPSLFSRVPEGSITRDLCRAQLVLYGDFHTLEQSQRGFLRLVRSVQLHSPKNITLALEMFRKADQEHIDAYLSRQIDDDQFLELIDYEQNWGFAWEHYRPILDFARKEKLKVVGINTRRAGADDLRVRDSFAAETIAQRMQEDPEGLVMCLVGEYHLADDFLPFALQESGIERQALVRVVNNIDKYYFHELISRNLDDTQYLRIGRALYCVMNCPPWIKWKSLANWEERNLGLGDGFGPEDVDFQFLLILKAFASFLKANTPGGLKQDFYVISDIDGYFEDQRRMKQLSKRDMSIIRARLNHVGYYLVSSSRTILLERPSLNHLAAACGEYMYLVLSGPSENRQDESAMFLSRVATAMAATFAVKTLNPRVKRWDLTDHREHLKSVRGLRLIGERRCEREASKLLVGFVEKLQNLENSQEPVKITQAMLKNDRELHGGLSTRIGNMLAAEVYRDTMEGRLHPEVILSFYTNPSKTTEQIFEKICSASQCIQFSPTALSSLSSM